jgi:putative transposase
MEPVVADDHKGLGAAAKKVLHASLQRCRVRFTRNCLCIVHPDKGRWLADIRALLEAHCI